MKRKAEKAAECQKKKSRRFLSTSARQSVPQEPVQESPVVSSAPETPTVTPKAVPQRSMAAAIRATTSEPSSECQRIRRERKSSSILQKLAEDLKGRCDYMKEWYESRNTTIVDGVKKITAGYEFLLNWVATLWDDRVSNKK
ncbi:hypothetical protein Hanom_Chr09g00765651 [Helianthus anomalus]